VRYQVRMMLERMKSPQMRSAVIRKFIVEVFSISDQLRRIDNTKIQLFQNRVRCKRNDGITGFQETVIRWISTAQGKKSATTTYSIMHRKNNCGIVMIVFSFSAG